MSVVYGDRGLSEMEFWKQILKIEKLFVIFLLRDFGVKNRSREPEFYIRAYKMSDEDAEMFRKLCETYDIEKITDNYPEWLICKFREDLLNIIQKCKMNIRDANDVIPAYESEYYERRYYQDEAIRCCGKLYDEFTLIKNILHIDEEKYMRYVKMIEYEATLLKGWRKSDNKLLRNIKKKGK